MSQMTSIFDAIDHASLTGRYLSIVIAVILSSMMEFFDFFLIGFVVSILSKSWHLTFGEASIVLLSAGIGAIVGGFLMGIIGDRWGRKAPFLSGILLYSIGTGLMALVPDRGWIILSVLRFIVGIGVGGMGAGSTTMLVELTPTKHRTYLSSFSVLLAPAGVLLASILAASIAPILGWRGLFVIGLLPALIAIWVAIGVPESPRWLASKGRIDEARRAVAWVFRLPEDSVPRRGPLVSISQSTSYLELFRYPKSLWAMTIGWLGATTASYGITLWGPTILSLQLGITPARAAFLFILVSLAGLLGRIAFSFLPVWIGRRGAAIAGGGGALFLLIAAFTNSVLLGSISLLWFLLIVTDFFLDGSFSNLAPYSPEVFPARLRSHGVGAVQVVNGIGKILGPLGLAMIAGSRNLVSPSATLQAITPAFIYLAVASLLTFVVFLVVNVEPQGRSLEHVETPYRFLCTGRAFSRRGFGIKIQA
jgi:putative MFS transporter